MNDFLRLVLVAFLVLHAASHIVWFLATWTRYKLGVVDGPWILPGEVRLLGIGGRVAGALALVATGLFLLGAIGLAGSAPGWRTATQYGIFASLVVVLPWWPQIPHRIGLQAVIADIVLWFVIVLPISVDII